MNSLEIALGDYISRNHRFGVLINEIVFFFRFFLFLHLFSAYFRCSVVVGGRGRSKFSCSNICHICFFLLILRNFFFFMLVLIVWNMRRMTHIAAKHISIYLHILLLKLFNITRGYSVKRLANTHRDYSIIIASIFDPPCRDPRRQPTT